MAFDSQRQRHSVCISAKKGLHLDPQLFLDKSPIPDVEETKFLGVIFDRKLSFVPRLKYVKKKAFIGPEHFKSYWQYRMGSRPKFHATTIDL